MFEICCSFSIYLIKIPNEDRRTKTLPWLRIYHKVKLGMYYQRYHFDFSKDSTMITFLLRYLLFKFSKPENSNAHKFPIP